MATNLRHRIARQQIARQRIGVHCLWTMLLLLTICSCSQQTVFAWDEQSSENWTVPVESLAVPQANPQMVMTAANEPAPQVTPAARLPQYQLEQQYESTDEPVDSPLVRFLLTTPGRPLLVDVSVFVDGLPFRAQRELRIAKLLELSSQPAVPEIATPVPGSETQSAADPATQPATEPATEPAAQPVTEPAAQPVTEPAAQQVTEPAAQPMTEPGMTDIERFRRYVKESGSVPDASEARWFLSNWVDGPEVLFLQDHFQRFRADEQPLFTVLDQDLDGRISAEEVEGALRTIETCDLNRDDIVESTEISRAATSPANWRTSSKSYVALIRIPNGQLPADLLPRVITSFGGADADAAQWSTIDLNGDGQLDESEQKSLQTRPVDLGLRIDFTSNQPDQSRLSIVSDSELLRDSKHKAVISGTTITLNSPGYALELSAVQRTVSDQISLGCINDGYAILPDVDPDGDGRLTIRERRTFLQRLTSFDLNRDGSISKDECRPVIRLCVGLGPTVHEPLSRLRRTGDSSQNSSETPAVAGPEWFLEMDKNRDLDLTRKEFPGTDEQFQKLDSDQDGLVSAQEATSAEL